MEALLIYGAIIGGIWVIVKIWETIGRYIEQKKLETREQVYRELLGNVEVQKVFEKYKSDMESLGYNRDAVENYQSEFYQSVYRTPYQELLGKCPSCGNGYLRAKAGQYGKFIGCSNYPGCRYTIDIQAAREKHKSSINKAVEEDFKKAYQ